MGKPRSQPERRRSFNNIDQFGREWLVTIEIDTGHPTGTLNPCFDDDVQTPQKYLSVPDESPRTIIVDWQRWVLDLQEAEREYRKHFDMIGMQLYGDGFKSDEMWANPRPNHSAMVGPAPRSWKEVEALHKAILKPKPASAAAGGWFKKEETVEE